MITHPIALAALRTSAEACLYVSAHPQPAPLAIPMALLRALVSRAAYWSVVLGEREALDKVAMLTRNP